jgi:hypothetical protein
MPAEPEGQKGLPVLTLFKVLTIIFGIVAVICLIGLTDTTHQMFGPDDPAVLAVTLILFVLSGMAWMLAARTEPKASPGKLANGPCAPAGATEVQTVPGSGMPISAEEAAGILRNWRDENRRIRFRTFQVPEEAIDYLCSGLGWIEELTSFMVRIANRNDKGVVRGDLHGCIVSLRRATGFMVWDWRNVPPVEQAMKKSLHESYDMSLTIEFRSGARCELDAVKFGHELDISE